MSDKHTHDDFTPLHFGYEDDGLNCLIGSHCMFFARVQQTPKHNALQYARLFSAAPAMLAALKASEKMLTESLEAAKAGGYEVDLKEFEEAEEHGKVLRAAIALAEGK